MFDGYLSPIRCFASVGRYYQGPGAIELLPELAAKEGNSAFVLIDGFFYRDFSVSLREKFEAAGIRFDCMEAALQITDASIAEVRKYVDSLGYLPDIFIGIGGGKTCDTIKCFSDFYGKPVIVAPTVIATDAPPTSHSMVYREDGSSYVFAHKRSPEYVVTDTQITVNAPAVTFAAGIGDALATYFECQAIDAFGHPTLAGRKDFCRTRTGKMIARLCYDLLMENAEQAYRDTIAHKLTREYEDATEALTLLSGLGVENTGCSVAHGLEKYIQYVSDRKNLHGQGVAYGTMVQIMREGRTEEFDRVYKLCSAVGLPVCLADLGASGDDACIDKLAAMAVTDYLINREPFEVTAEGLADAMRKIEAYGR